MKQAWLIMVGLLLALTLSACDPMAVRPTPQVIIVTNTPTREPTPDASPTATPTRTPPPSPTPNYTPTPTPFPCEADGQLLTVDEYRVDSVRETLAYNIYVPPCYAESGRRFPVLYLLASNEEGYTQWLDLNIVEALDRGIRLGALPPMIVVMPSYGSIGVRDAFPPDPSFETVLIEELLPDVQADLCTVPERDYRALGGIDRGGFWAFSLGLRYPDLFSAIAAHSGVFNEEADAQFNPLEIARNSTLLPEANLRLYLDNGADDTQARNQQLLSDRLSARRIPHTYIINPVGGHDNAYWASRLSEYLAFYGETWPRNYDELPSCLEPLE